MIGAVLCALLVYAAAVEPPTNVAPPTALLRASSAGCVHTSSTLLPECLK